MVFETSAKTNANVDDMIFELAFEIDQCKDAFETVSGLETVSAISSEDQPTPSPFISIGDLAEKF
jgi:hypothetical protein